MAVFIDVAWVYATSLKNSFECSRINQKSYDSTCNINRPDYETHLARYCTYLSQKQHSSMEKYPEHLRATAELRINSGDYTFNILRQRDIRRGHGGLENRSERSTWEGRVNKYTERIFGDPETGAEGFSFSLINSERSRESGMSDGNIHWEGRPDADWCCDKDA